jgi:menaquinone-dependent protoporphyrinogen IX oxidase/Pyruvate/2-oxoacid:ferredoxin oxidoreductase delta subunit
MDTQSMHTGYRILIYFHTASGNTGWITSQIARQLRDRGVEVVTSNIAHQQDTADMENFDVIGFGCPVMGFRPTFSMTDFISRLPMQQEKPAFIYVTCAGISASSLWMLSQLLNKKSWMVTAAEQFRGEVSWPVARLPGIIPDKGRPDARDLPSILQFCEVLYNTLNRLDEKRPVTPLAVPFAFLNPFSYMGRANKAPYLRSIMGTKKVIESRCTRCGTCQKYCASNAISLNPYPQFSSACTGCWGCYNICPESAISTFTGTRGRYTSRTEYLDSTTPGINNNQSSA